MGVVLTWILPNTLEDVLAIVLAGLAGYVALLNLPLRRSEAKTKLERVANNFVKVHPLPTIIQAASPSQHGVWYSYRSVHAKLG